MVTAGLVALGVVAAASAGGIRPPEMDYRKLGPMVRMNQQVFGNDISLEVEILVAPDGTPLSCTEVGGKVSETIKQAACDAFLKTGPMTPATLDGVPAYGILSTGITLRSSTSRSQALAVRFDMVLDVASLPEAFSKQPTVMVNAAISNDGALLRCEAGDERVALARAACSALGQNASLPRSKDASGEPVAYIRSYNVYFKVSKGAEN